MICGYSYKTWTYQRLIKQVKSPSSVSRASERDKLVSEHPGLEFGPANWVGLKTGCYKLVSEHLGLEFGPANWVGLEFGPANWVGLETGRYKTFRLHIYLLHLGERRSGFAFVFLHFKPNIWMLSP